MSDIQRESAMRTIWLTASLLLPAALCQAQDVSLLAGRLDVLNSAQHSFGVGLGYAQRLGEHAALSAEYVNEGHPALHHRDGLAPQFWLRTATPEQGLSFAFGAGPYYYFDTTSGSGSRADYRNEHGWGTLVSASVKYHLEKRTYLELRLNRVHGRGEHDSTMLLAGVGYELRNLAPEVVRSNAEAGDRMIMLHAGRAIVNSFESETAVAKAAEFRSTLTENAEWSAMLLNEGQVGLVERKGVAAQLWLLRPFTEHTVLEMGGGAYAMRDQVNRNDVREEPKNHLVPIVSVGIRYRINHTWRAQLTWSRVVTPYHRDADVFLLGGGVAF